MGEEAQLVVMDGEGGSTRLSEGRETDALGGARCVCADPARTAQRIAAASYGYTVDTRGGWGLGVRQGPARSASAVWCCESRQSRTWGPDLGHGSSSVPIEEEACFQR